jgi:hypothetical protein
LNKIKNGGITTKKASSVARAEERLNLSMDITSK